MSSGVLLARPFAIPTSRAASVPSMAIAVKPVLPILVATSVTPSAIRGGNAVLVLVLVVRSASAAFVAPAVTAGSGVVPLSRVETVVRNRG